MRVVTQNLWGRRGDWTARRAVLSAGLRDLRPDLVSLQEAITTADYDMAADLLGSEYQIVYQSSPEPDGQSAAIASRWPIESVREVDLHVTPRTADFACTTIVAEIRAPEPYGALLFVSHLPNWQLNFERERELQAVAAARFVEELAGQGSIHVIVAGDLTADPDSSSVRFWTGRQSLEGMSVCYRDAWESTHPGEPGLTYIPENPLLADWDWPFRRLDYVFVRCGAHGGPTLAVRSCARIFDEPLDGIWASDHFGIVADLAVPVPRGTAIS